MSHLRAGMLERVVCALCEFILWVTTSVIFFILVANTVLRYSRGSSLQWANELPELLFPWLVMAGIVLASVRGSHIATTFLMETVPSAVRRVVGVVVWLAVAALYGSLSWATFRMLDIVRDERSPILQVSGAVTYSCMLVGMTLLGLLALQSAWRVARGSMAFPPDITAEAPAVAQG